MAPAPGKGVKEMAESMDPYGDMVPYADPSWYQSVRKPPLGFMDLTLSTSITHLISMNHMLHSGKRYARGWMRRSSHM